MATTEEHLSQARRNEAFVEMLLAEGCDQPARSALDSIQGARPGQRPVARLKALPAMPSWGSFHGLYLQDRVDGVDLA